MKENLIVMLRSVAFFLVNKELLHKTLYNSKVNENARCFQAEDCGSKPETTTKSSVKIAWMGLREQKQDWIDHMGIWAHTQWHHV